MANTELRVKVTFEAVQDSPELQELLRQIVRQELISAIENLKAEQLLEESQNAGND
jgi:hypothetical protein